jgi:hypothetical protein
MEERERGQLAIIKTLRLDKNLLDAITAQCDQQNVEFSSFMRGAALKAVIGRSNSTPPCVLSPIEANHEAAG